MSSDNDTTNVTFILDSDIDMSDVEDWNRINNFKGTFDGNCHYIKGLNNENNHHDNTDFEYGSDPYGLFGLVTESATVKNVGVIDMNLSAYAQIGGIAGKNMGTIYNCVTTGKLDSSYWSGGIVGQNMGTVDHCNTYIDFTADNQCNGGIVGHNGGEDTDYTGTGIISYCNASGTLHASQKSGGLVGHNEGKTLIEHCITLIDIDAPDYSTTVGTVIGWGTEGYESDPSIININDVTYRPNRQFKICGDSNYTGSGGTFKAYIKTPCIDPTNMYKGGFYSNIYGALYKYYNGDDSQINEENISLYIQGLYENDSTHLNIANINEALCEYMNTGNGNDLINYLIQDINSTTSNNYYSNINKYYTSNDTIVVPDSGEDWTPALTGEVEPDWVSIPDRDNIFEELYFFMKKYITETGRDFNYTKDDIENYIRNFYTINYNLNYEYGNEYNILLANINDFIQEDNADFYEEFYSKMISFEKYENNTNYSDAWIGYKNYLHIYTPESNGTPTVSGGTEYKKGEVIAPSADNIGTMLYYRFILDNKNNITETEVKNYINQYDTNDDLNKIYLAQINDHIFNNDKTTLNAIYNKIIGDKSKYIFTQLSYPQNNYDIKFKTYSINTSYSETIKGKPITETEEYWDTSDPDIQNYMLMYLLSKRGIHIVSPEQAANYEYLKNILETGEGVLTTFDPQAATQLLNMTDEQIMAMKDEEYNKLLGIDNTNVAVETHLQEVADEKNLKKAEAKYEADMRRIDFKDRKYDRDLAALEAERNATKNEMETLKTVAKDNVDRTFKLFS